MQISISQVLYGAEADNLDYGYRGYKESWAEYIELEKADKHNGTNFAREKYKELIKLYPHYFKGSK